MLIILGTGQLINASVGSVGFLLTMTAHQKLEVFNWSSMILINFFLNFILIPIYGAIGAAIATGVSVALINLLRLYEVFKYLNIHPYKLGFCKPIMSGFITTVLWLLFSKIIALDRVYVLILIITLFSLIYFSIIFVMGIDKEDKIILNAFINKFRKA